MKFDESKIRDQLSVAIENHKNKKFQLAEKLYKEILILNKDNLEANFHLGTLYSQLRKFELAKPLLMKAKDLNPNNPKINLHIGNLFFSTGELILALNYFDKVIQVQPNFTLAYFNKGIILYNQKKRRDAIKCFQKVVEEEPNNIDALNVLGIISQELGELQKSLFYLKKSISIAPNNFRVINTLLNFFKSIQLSNLSESNSSDLNKLFTFLYEKNSIDHNSLFNNAKNLIFFEKNKYEIQQLLDRNIPLLNSEVVKIALKKKLFLLTLQKALFRDKFLERFLCQIRKEFLLLFKKKNESIVKEFLNFIISFAEQSFLNEYLFFQTDDEIKIIHDLKKKVENDKNINELEISILGCYLPLNTSKIIEDKLNNYSSKNVLFNDLIQIQIKDTLKEKDIQKSINSFDIISDKISNKVRNQYEENPYPRWRYADISPKNSFLSILNNNIKPNKITTKNENFKRNVLIAGCGTGQQLVHKASYENVNILAVDLSLASLSFAKRKMQELKHTNIEFLHGDILNLKKIK